MPEELAITMLAGKAKTVRDDGCFSDPTGSRGGATDPFLTQPFGRRGETPQDDAICRLATSGALSQTFVNGPNGLRLAADGLPLARTATLPSGRLYRRVSRNAHPADAGVAAKVLA